MEEYKYTDESYDKVSVCFIIFNLIFLGFYASGRPKQ